MHELGVKDEGVGHVGNLQASSRPGVARTLADSIPTVGEGLGCGSDISRYFADRAFASLPFEQVAIPIARDSLTNQLRERSSKFIRLWDASFSRRDTTAERLRVLDDA